MSWLTRLVESAVATAERRGWVQRPRPVHRHVVRGGVQESVAGPPGTAASAYYGGSRVRRDLTPRQQIDLIGMAEFLVANDAVASRLVDIRTALVCGEGWTPVATSTVPEYRDAVQRRLECIWEILEWEDRLFARVRDLGVTGELIHWKPPANTAEGYWEPGTILPHNVDTVLTHPLNADRLMYLVLHKPGLEWQGVGGKTVSEHQFRIVQREKFGDDRRRYTGEVFFLGVNRFPGGTRGLSDTLPWREWIDMYGQALYTAQERLRAQNAYLFDVTLQGADEDQILFRAQQIREDPVRSGSVRVHSEKEKWDAVAPSLNAGDSDVLLDRMFKQILGSAGVPIHWWTDGGDVNRATAQEMDAPVYATVRNRKREVRGFIQQEVGYALQDVGDKGALVTPTGQQVPLAEQGFELQSRDPDPTAYDVVGATLLTLSQACAIARQDGLLNDREAAMVFRQAVTAQTGLELEPEPEPIEDGALEQAEREARDVYERHRARLERQEEPMGAGPLGR